MPTITIGIPAYNEELNIQNLLRALVSQQCRTTAILEIMVIVDGCSDNTRAQAETVTDARIRIIEFPDRRGLMAGQNEIVKHAAGDVLVLLDADVLPDSESFIDNLVQPLIENPRVGLAGALVQSAPARGLFENIIAKSHSLKNEIYRQIRQGHNIYSCHGRARAFSRKLYTRITWPATFPEDSFSYLHCLQEGMQFRVADRATVFFRSPRTLKDHYLQSVRFASGKQIIQKFFPPELVRREYHIPTRAIIRSVLKYLRKNPVETIAYIGIVAAIHGIALVKPRPANSLIAQSASSKEVII